MMKQRFLGKILLSLALAVCGASARADSVKLSGAMFDVYYDSTYWSGISLNGNTIALDTQLDFTGLPGIAWYTEFASGLTLVAHSGYVLNGVDDIGITGSYSQPGSLNWPYQDGRSGITAAAMVFSGADFGDYLGWVSTGVFVDSTAEASAGPFGAVDPIVSSTTPGLYQQLRLNPILSLLASPRTATVSLTGVSFNLDVTAVSAVPELEIQAMLLGGLLMVGALARTRRP